MNPFEKCFFNLNITEIPKCTLPTGTTMTQKELMMPDVINATLVPLQAEETNIK